MEAGPELDALVATEVMGWCFTVDPRHLISSEYPKREWWIGSDRDRLVKDWSPSTDIADAWAVVEKFQNGAVCLDTVLDPNEYGPFPHWRFRIYKIGESKVVDGKRQPIATAIGGSARLAICHTALLTTLESPARVDKAKVRP